MAKREHHTAQSYIEWLKSLGCVFYAPLTNGDLTDHISGQPLVVTNGTVTWDSVENAYKFYGPNTLNTYIAHWQNLNLNLDTSNLAGSWMCEVNGDNSNIIPICFGGRNFAQSIITGNINQWFKWATTLPNVAPRKQWWYTDGEPSSLFPNGYDRGSSPIVLTSAAQYSVECNPSGSSSLIMNKTYYMRNAMIFNRELTQQEVRDVQGI